MYRASPNPQTVHPITPISLHPPSKAYTPLPFTRIPPQKLYTPLPLVSARRRWQNAGMTHALPTPRGTLTPNRSLSDLTWLRVGGPADYLFQPADVSDLAGFLAALPASVPVFPMGVGSNLIVRDGGIRAVVIRLGRGFNAIEITGNRITAGAATLDSHLARRAAEAGLDLTFLRTIPGSIGGAVRMNAGCYGHYVTDFLEEIQIVTRAGQVETLPASALNLRYRQSDLPEGAVVISATFRNPVGHSSTGRADDSHDLKAWKVIDDAGMRGARLGGAQMSEMHSNFLINAGGATAADLENLGEEVRKRVFQTSGITLEWEIMRVGEPAAE